MAKIKSERHHWWPEGVSAYWADQEGGVNWLLPDGAVRRSVPKNFGVIGNGHAIKLGGDLEKGSVWDSSFESEFQNADDNFPSLIQWLDTLDRSGPPFDRPLAERIKAEEASDEQFAQLIECLVSLAARSPMHREQGVALAEHLRGPLPERERNSLIGANIQRTLRNAVRNLGGLGKALVAFSPEREFLFGDGFYNNLTTNGEHWHSPKMFVPLTPWMAVLFTRPMSYTSDPRLFTLSVSAAEADALNYAVQVYARQMVFYRSEAPSISDAYALGRHQIFADDRNSVDALAYAIPGTPDRDANMDAILALISNNGAP
ncbi:hypothetical protein [Citromicrobium bathyomarinum]|uniref:hypothetical protein n=1 Tax=Citromicrobium bathyomarinum TaxID=72174 RepID=UPI00315B1C20